MPTLKEYNSYGEDLERLLLLRTSPIAVKMLEKEEEIPEGAIRPKKDRGYHLAQCQTFAMSRRQGASIAMLKEDHWCWAPLMGYGLGENPHDPFVNEHTSFPCLEYGKYIGIVSAPLKTANFEPDLILIYSNTAQLRSMLSVIKQQEKSLLTSEFDPIDSCVFSVVPVLLNGKYRITLPDPGDYERAMAGEDEIILSVPKDKIEGLVSGLRKLEERKAGYTHHAMEMRPDFPRPEFYKRLFKQWSLDVED
jgi:uncharacterized protein (DUF169 family)